MDINNQNSQNNYDQNSNINQTNATMQNQPNSQSINSTNIGQNSVQNYNINQNPNQQNEDFSNKTNSNLNPMFSKSSDPQIQQMAKPVMPPLVNQVPNVEANNVIGNNDLNTEINSNLTAQQSPLGQESPNQETEKKHKPVISTDWGFLSSTKTVVTVKVGEIFHVMEKDHYISAIEIYKNNSLAAKVNLMPIDIVEPTIQLSLNVNVGDLIKAVAICNVHGSWESSIMC